MASGGIPAAFLQQHGDATGRKGIFFGLAHPGAGVDWIFTPEARRHEAVAATATQDQGGGVTITYTLAGKRAVGTAGNDWQIDIAQAAALAVTVDDATKRIRIAVPDGGTVAQVAAAYNASEGAGLAVVTGRGASTRAGQLGFSGGLDPESIVARIDADLKQVFLRYHTDDTQAMLLAQAPYDLGDGSFLYAALVGDTAPENRAGTPVGSIPFDRYFSQGSLPPIASDGAIDARIARTLATLRCNVADMDGTVEGDATSSQSRTHAWTIVTPEPTEDSAHFLLTLPAGRAISRVTAGDGEDIAFTRTAAGAQTWLSDLDFFTKRLLFVETAAG